MESSYLVVFSVVAGALLVLTILTTLIGYSRLSAMKERQDDLSVQLTTQALPKQLEKAVITSESSRDRVDNALLELQKYREEVHREMQRFYGIMRRNEKTALVGRVEAPDDGASEIPDEIAASSLKKESEEEEPISKAELRRQAREAGL